MASIQNDNDALLQAATTRIVSAGGNLAELRGVKISGTSQLLKSLAGGGTSPSAITLTAKLTFLTGTPAWSVLAGTATLTGTGLTRTISGNSITSDTVTIRAAIVEGGITYSDDFTIARVSDGGFGDSIDIVFRRSETQPSMPQPSAGTPPGWYTNVDAIPAGPGFVWSSFGKRLAGAQSYTWQTPVKVEAEDGGEQGAPGMSVAEVTIYQRGTNQPGTPSGGSFAFGSNTTTPPSGWSATIPAGTGPVWISKTTASIQGTTGTVSLGGWTVPAVAFRDGTDGADGDSVDIVFTRSASQPATPAASSGTPSGWHTVVASVPAGAGAIWSSVGKRASASSTYTWQAPVKIEGTDGTPGMSIAELTIYIRSTSAPATPAGGSFNFGTRTLTPPAGWSATLPAGAAPAYASMVVAAINGTTGTDSNLAWSTPVEIYRDSQPGRRGTVNLFGNITGTTWSDSTANSLITSNTGAPDRITGDMVTLANSSAPWAQTRRWTGSAWEVMPANISGDMIIPKTLAADAISGLGALALLQSINLGSSQVTGQLPSANIGSIPASKVTNLGDLAYADKVAANQIGAGTLAAGVVYAGTISASNVTSGTMAGVTLRIGTGGLITASGGSGSRFYVNSSGYTYVDTLQMYGGLLAKNVTVTSAVSSPGLNAVNSSTGSTACGLRGQNSPGGTGRVGLRSGQAFYADVGGYGPFTGTHDAVIEKSAACEAGDIVADVVCIAKRGVSDSIFLVDLAVGVNNPRAVGIAAGRIPFEDHEPAAMVESLEPVYSYADPDSQSGSVNLMAPCYVDMAGAHDFLTINAVGEGLVNVCGRGGDIEAGDLIVCSDLPGKGQRQADNLVRNYTVAKAREAVTFDDPDDVRMIPCIYLCG